MFVKQLGAKFWIGSDPRDESLNGFAGDGGLGIPQFYLVDARGTVVGDGVPTEAQIEKLLADVVDRRLDRKLHDSLAKAAAFYARGSLGKAHELAGAHTSSTDSKLAVDAQYLQTKIGKVQEISWRQARQQVAKAGLSERYGSFLLWKYEFAGLEFGRWAGQQLASIKQDRKLWKSRELERWRSAWRVFESTLKRETMSGSAYDRKRARELYGKLRKQYRGSVPARLAGGRLKALDQGS